MTDASVNLISAARALQPLLRACRDEIESNRELPRALVDALDGAGLFRLYLPRALGGYEVDPVTFDRVVEEVALVDGSSGWVVINGAVLGMLGAFLREEAARQIFDDAHAILAGSINPTGKAIATDDGFRVTGRWNFASGIRHCTWVVANCVVFDGEERRVGATGGPDLRFVIVPREQCEILYTWHVSGLRGTGSHSFVISDVFVPEKRSLIAFAAPPHQPGPLYACPFITLFAAALAAPALGMARGAIDALVELANEKTPMGSSTLLRERPSVQSDIARAEALVRSGRAFLFEALGDLWTTMVAVDEVTLRQRALVRIACAHAAQSAAQAVDLMYNAGGATSLFSTGPLERHFRDVHAATQHIGVVAHNYEIAGRVLLGMNPGTPRF